MSLSFRFEGKEFSVVEVEFLEQMSYNELLHEEISEELKKANIEINLEDLQLVREGVSLNMESWEKWRDSDKFRNGGVVDVVKKGKNEKQDSFVELHFDGRVIQKIALEEFKNLDVATLKAQICEGSELKGLEREVSFLYKGDIIKSEEWGDIKPENAMVVCLGLEDERTMAIRLGVRIIYKQQLKRLRRLKFHQLLELCQRELSKIDAANDSLKQLQLFYRSEHITEEKWEDVAKSGEFGAVDVQIRLPPTQEKSGEDDEWIKLEASQNSQFKSLSEQVEEYSTTTSTTTDDLLNEGDFPNPDGNKLRRKSPEFKSPQTPYIATPDKEEDEKDAKYTRNEETKTKPLPNLQNGSFDPMEFAESVVYYLRSTNRNLESIKGKDVVLVVGETGVGKSTTINFLAGCKMRRKVADEDELSDIDLPLHIPPTLPRLSSESEAKGVVIDAENPVVAPGHTGDSKTLHVEGISVGEFVICDTPGFLDSKGSIQDFANAVSIRNALKQCLSFRIVYLFAENYLGTGARKGRLILEHMGSLSNFLFPFEKAMPGMTAFLTHQNYMTARVARDSLKKCYKMLGHDYPEESKFLFALIEKRFPSSNLENLSLLIMNPLGKKGPKEYLDHLRTLKKISPADLEIRLPLKNDQIEKIEHAFQAVENKILEDLNINDFFSIAKHFDMFTILAESLRYPNFIQRNEEMKVKIDQHISSMACEARVIMNSRIDYVKKEDIKELGIVLTGVQNATAAKLFDGYSVLLAELHSFVLRHDLNTIESDIGITFDDDNFSILNAEFHQVVERLRGLKLMTDSKYLKRHLDKLPCKELYRESCEKINKIVLQTSENAGVLIEKLFCSGEMEKAVDIGHEIGQNLSILQKASSHLQEHLPSASLNYKNTIYGVELFFNDNLRVCESFLVTLEGYISQGFDKAKGCLSALEKNDMFLLETAMIAIRAAWLSSMKDHLTNKDAYPSLMKRFKTFAEAALKKLDALISERKYATVKPIVDLMIHVASFDVEGEILHGLSRVLELLLKVLRKQFRDAMEQASTGEYKLSKECLSSLRAALLIQFSFLDTYVPKTVSGVDSLMANDSERKKDGNSEVKSSSHPPRANEEMLPVDSKKEGKHASTDGIDSKNEGKHASTDGVSFLDFENKAKSQQVAKMEKHLSRHLMTKFSSICDEVIVMLNTVSPESVSPKSSQVAGELYAERHMQLLSLFDKVEAFTPLARLIDLKKLGFSKIVNKVQSLSRQCLASCKSKDGMSADKSINLFRQLWFAYRVVKKMRSMQLSSVSTPPTSKPKAQKTVLRDRNVKISFPSRCKKLMSWHGKEQIGLKVSQKDQFVHVTQVVSGSIAKGKGVQVGWIIKEVNGKRIRTINFLKTILGQNKNKTILFTKKVEESVPDVEIPQDAQKSEATIISILSKSLGDVVNAGVSLRTDMLKIIETWDKNVDAAMKQINRILGFKGLGEETKDDTKLKIGDSSTEEPRRNMVEVFGILSSVLESQDSFLGVWGEAVELFPGIKDGFRDVSEEMRKGLKDSNTFTRSNVEKHIRCYIKRSDEELQVQVITFGRNVLKVLEEARKSIQSFFDNRINFADEYADLKAKIEVIENNLDQRLPRFLKMRNFREVKNVLDQVRGSRGVFLKCLDIVQDQIRIWWEEYEQEISHLSIELEDRNLTKFDVRKLKNYVQTFNEAICLKDDFPAITTKAKDSWQNLLKFFEDLKLMLNENIGMRTFNFRVVGMVWRCLRKFKSCDGLRAGNEPSFETKTREIQTNVIERIPTMVLDSFRRALASSYVPLPTSEPEQKEKKEKTKSKREKSVEPIFNRDLIGESVEEDSFRPNAARASKILKSISSDDIRVGGHDYETLHQRLIEITEKWGNVLLDTLFYLADEKMVATNLCEEALIRVVDTLKRTNTLTHFEKQQKTVEIAIERAENFQIPDMPTTKEVFSKFFERLIKLKGTNGEKFKEMLKNVILNLDRKFDKIENMLRSNKLVSRDLSEICNFVHFCHEGATAVKLPSRYQIGLNNIISRYFDYKVRDLDEYERQKSWNEHATALNWLRELHKSKLSYLSISKEIKIRVAIEGKKNENYDKALAGITESVHNLDLLNEVVNTDLLCRQLRDVKSGRDGITKYKDLVSTFAKKIKSSKDDALRELNSGKYVKIRRVLQNFKLLSQEKFELDHQDIFTRVKQSSEALNNEISEHIQNLENQAINCLKTNKRKADDYLNNIRSFEKEFQESGHVDKVIKDFLDQITKAKDTWIVSNRKPCVGTLGDFLIRLNKEKTHITEEKIIKHVDDNIKDILEHYKKKKIIDLTALDVYLCNENAEEICCTQPIFKKVRAEKFNKLVGRITADHALEQLKEKNGDTIDTKKLKRELEKYQDTHKEFMKNGRKSYRSFINDISKLAKKINTDKWNAGKQEMASLLGGISAFWSIWNERENKIPIILHPVQIFTLFRVLGVDTGKFSDKILPWSSHLKNHLAEVETGGGKSLILGMLTTVLVLLGAKVNCACYSAYLSKRDKNSFDKFWKQFGFKVGVTQESDITYSTLKDLANILLNERGNIRELSKSFVEKKKSQKQEGREGKRLRVLLIDEVDVFFSEDFCGKTYNPACKFKGEEEYNLLKHIWDARGGNPNIHTIKASKAYQKMKAKYSDFEWLLEFNLPKIISALKEFKSHKYSVKTNPDTGESLIAYREHGRETTSRWCGYMTDFAYMEQVDLKVISSQVALTRVGITMTCGHFSYANIPNKYFDAILGVTGTLKDMPKHEKDVVENDYNVKSTTLTPSIYRLQGYDLFKKEADTILESGRMNHWQKLAVLIGRAVASHRCVLVFFDTNDDICDFTQTSYGKDIETKLQPHTVTEKTPNKDRHIQLAMKQGAVTYFPRVFGRGLDFQCLDKEVEDNGGVLVIQTFFSLSKSEEKQIQGRTARQGKSGSYKLLLCAEVVAGKLGLTLEELKKAAASNTLYSTLNSVRESLSSKQSGKRKEDIKKANELDKVSYETIDILQNGKGVSGSQSATIGRNLKTLNSPRNAFHFVFCLDSSGSMHVDDANGVTPWKQLMKAYNDFMQNLCAMRSGDWVTVILFSSGAQTLFSEDSQVCRSKTFSHIYGGTDFGPAIQHADDAIKAIPENFTPILLFLSDGEGDNEQAIEALHKYDDRGLQVNTIFFGTDNGAEILRAMAGKFGSSGQFHLSINEVQLTQTFQSILPVEITSSVTEYGE